MSNGYFQRVAQQTPTRFWINNPTGTEVDQAIAAGAINCTTNPTYGSRLLKGEPDYIHRLIDRVVKETTDDNLAADRVYQLAAARLLERFRPLYDGSHGSQGYVTIQGDPHQDEDPDAIVEAALRYRALGPNFIAKIPVTAAGLAAIERLVGEDVPICATEVFSLAQTISVCERYREAAKKSGQKPPFYVTHITGILDEYLQKTVQREQIAIAPEVLAEAGCAVARKEYRLLKERGYETTLLGGGARGTQHFTEFVGGDVHITINWSTAQTLIERDEPVVARIDAQVPESVVAELSAKLPDFRRAYEEEGLAVAEYAAYGPVTFFRDNFIAGYRQLLAEVAARREHAVA